MLSIKEEFLKVTPPFIWMEVNDNDFDKVLDVDLWPVGCIMAPSRGFLKKDFLVY